MNEGNVSFEITGRVGKVTINRPRQLNALDLETIKELRNIVLSVLDSKKVNALLITGAGERAFSVGVDRKELELGSSNPLRAEELETISRETLDMIAGLGKPTVCAIGGYALGLGFQLALAANFRVASTTASFGLPEINMGFFPSLGATQRLTRLVGESNAAELILTGEPIGAKRAFFINLVNRVAPLDHVREAAEDLAFRLAAKSAPVVKLALESMRAGQDMTLAEGLAYEAALARQCPPVPERDLG